MLDSEPTKEYDAMRMEIAKISCENERLRELVYRTDAGLQSMLRIVKTMNEYDPNVVELHGTILMYHSSIMRECDKCDSHA